VRPSGAASSDEALSRRLHTEKYLQRCCTGYLHFDFCKREREMAVAGELLEEMRLRIEDRALRIRRLGPLR
jgi:hypothetical protein